MLTRGPGGGAPQAFGILHNEQIVPTLKWLSFDVSDEGQALFWRWLDAASWKLSEEVSPPPLRAPTQAMNPLAGAPRAARAERAALRGRLPGAGGRRRRQPRGWRRGG